jgi:hypothetical protein
MCFKIWRFFPRWIDSWSTSEAHAWSTSEAPSLTAPIKFMCLQEKSFLPGIGDIF